MGYRGKLEAQEKARLMRAENKTLADIAATLGVASRRSPSGSATSPSPRPNAVTAQNEPRTQRIPPSSARSKS
jgi:hypothetical protein